MGKQHVLVCPIDWGLGHATRCVPLIRMLLDRGHEVSIASSGDALLLLQKEFPELTTHHLTPYRPRYSSGDAMVGIMAFQSLHFARTIRREHEELEGIVLKDQIDLVISDNRFGCWSAKVPSVIITHQMKILLPPWISFAANWFNHRYLKRFKACWIPDFPGKLALTHPFIVKTNLPVYFVGPLTRFHRLDAVDQRYDLLAIISGPEPQRSVFESIVRKQIVGLEKRIMIIRGLPGEGGKRKSTYGEEADHLPAEDMNDVIQQSGIVLSRSGYSTVMDLAVLGSKAIFVPTPGQTEQEYLAKELMRRRICYSESQQRFDLRNALERSREYSGFQITSRGNYLEEVLNQFGL